MVKSQGFVEDYQVNGEDFQVFLGIFSSFLGRFSSFMGRFSSFMGRFSSGKELGRGRKGLCRVSNFSFISPFNFKLRRTGGGIIWH